MPMSKPVSLLNSSNSAISSPGTAKSFMSNVSFEKGGQGVIKTGGSNIGLLGTGGMAKTYDPWRTNIGGNSGDSQNGGEVDPEQSSSEDPRWSGGPTGGPGRGKSKSQNNWNPFGGQIRKGEATSGQIKKSAMVRNADGTQTFTGFGNMDPGNRRAGRSWGQLEEEEESGGEYYEENQSNPNTKQGADYNEAAGNDRRGASITTQEGTKDLDTSPLSEARSGPLYNAPAKSPYARRTTKPLGLGQYSV